MREDLIKIIEIASNAPSGGNSQPWSFKIVENGIEVIAHPEKDHPILNYRNRGTLFAHGALLENIEIVASSFGYKSDIEITYKSNSNTLAKVVFKKEDIVESELYPYVPQRCTNRKSYRKESLTNDQTKYLFQSKESDAKNILFVKGDIVKKVSEQLPYDVKIFLKNKKLHSLFFQEVIWDKEKEIGEKGLFVKTMELNPQQTFFFKKYCNWSFARIFNKLGIPNLIYKDLVKVFSSSPVLGAVVVDNSDNNFITAGRITENIWLRATKLGLDFQLITGIPFLFQRVMDDSLEGVFSDEEKTLIIKSYRNLEQLFGVKNGIISSIFRIGYSDAPTAISKKSMPKII